MDIPPQCGISIASASRGAITAAMAASILGVGRSTIFELARAGHIRRVRLPGMRRPRLLRADVERLVIEGLDGADAQRPDEYEG